MYQLILLSIAFDAAIRKKDQFDKFRCWYLSWNNYNNTLFLIFIFVGSSYW